MDDRLIYYCKTKCGVASGYKTGVQFLVVKGSCVGVKRSIKGAYKKLREKLEREGVIKDGRFTADYTFCTPTEATTVVTGTSCGNLSRWTNRFNMNLSAEFKRG